MHSEWIAQQIGILQTTVLTGFRDVHRRIDDQDRSAAEWRRYMLRRLDKKNGNGRNGGRTYGKVACILGLVIIGTLIQVWPKEVGTAALKLGERLLLGAVKD